MKYLSLDIETTGLSLQSNIIQIAAIYQTPHGQNGVFNCLIDDELTHVEYGALAITAPIYKELARPTGVTPIYKIHEAKNAFSQFLKELSETDRFTVAGKNTANFDIPILTRWGYDTTRFSHRVLDVGSLYLPDFGKIPSLSEINKKLGRSDVSHDALQDCMDVVAAVEAKIRNKCL
jgi:DNA polymerase III epsilon subunit-like protein